MTKNVHGRWRAGSFLAVYSPCFALASAWIRVAAPQFLKSRLVMANDAHYPERFAQQALGHNSKAVRQALSRLARAGTIRRIRQGLYDLPRKHPIIGQTAPDHMAAVRALMEGSQAQWQVSGAYAANLLGLSEQVPAKIVILTDGVPRRVALGKLTLTFRRVAPRNLLAAGRPAGLVIQALRHLRAEGLEEGQLLELRSRLEPSTRAELAQLSPKLAAWMRPLVKKLTLEEKA